jgi:hypothetical protein
MRPTVPWHSIICGLPVALKWPCAIATEDSSCMQVMNSGISFLP